MRYKKGSVMLETYVKSTMSFDTLSCYWNITQNGGCETSSLR